MCAAMGTSRENALRRDRDHQPRDAAEQDAAMSVPTTHAALEG